MKFEMELKTHKNEGNDIHSSESCYNNFKSKLR